MKHKILRTLLLFVLAACGNVHAVTLGQIQVNSFLGEPLDAEIDVIGLTPGQHEDLRLRIANDVQFERLGITRTPFLASLTFDVAQSDGRWIVRTRSARPVTEPFLEFPLQMTWPGGQLIKQYTLLLDPPRRIQTARKARSTRQVPPQTPAVPQTGNGASEYGPVQPGETLWPIAKKLKPSGITTRQMAMALLRANPAAFINGDINKLRAGATLEIPQRAFIEQMDAKTARAEFAARTRPAAVATSPRVMEAPVPPAPAQAEAVDEQEAPVPAAPESEPTPKESAKEPQLRIVTEPEKSDAEPGSTQDLQDQLLVTMEEIESNRITTDAIESRLARMEAELERMQKLVELKDAQIAALESDVAAHEAIQKAAQEAEPPAPAAPTRAISQPATAPAPARDTPVTLPRVEPIPVAQAPPAPRPWYEEYVWVLWILLGLMGLTSLLMLIRRPQPVTENTVVAPLPEIPSAPARGPQTESPPRPVDLENAEEDFRRLAGQRAGQGGQEPGTRVEEAEELPELDLSQITEPDEDLNSAITESLLDDVLDEGKTLANSSAIIVDDTEFSDDDIASWVAELGKEAEQIDARSANDEDLSPDEDIPSILTELDDQLSVDRSVDALSGAARVPEPSATAHEDDTFNMSLDLARAYLEIGDQEGAREMLEQALAGARDPDHRRQIEELLQQID